MTKRLAFQNHSAICFISSLNGINRSTRSTQISSPAEYRSRLYFIKYHVFSTCTAFLIVEFSGGYVAISSQAQALLIVAAPSTWTYKSLPLQGRRPTPSFPPLSLSHLSQQFLFLTLIHFFLVTYLPVTLRFLLSTSILPLSILETHPSISTTSHSHQHNGQEGSCWLWG